MYLTLRSLAPEDDPEAIGILQQRGDYFRALIGRMPQAEHLALLRAALPEGATPGQKRLVGIESDGRIAGVLDVVMDYPHLGSASVGLFVLDPTTSLRHMAVPVAAMLIERALGEGIDLVFAACPDGWLPGERLLTSLGFRLVRASAMPRNPVLQPDPTSRNRVWALEVSPPVVP
ncbi:MAG: hypothetical protein JWN36_904 [Microbacteriaceae bacterium]|nr:hypothetical protein [Microbacteriaceae bacterium]